MDLACKCDGHNFIDMKMASYAYDTILQEQMRIKWLGGVATRRFKVECQSRRCVHEMALIAKGHFISFYYLL